MKKTLTGLVLTFALILSQFGCGPATIQQAANASAALAGDTRDSIKTVGDLYDNQTITLAQKDAIAGALLKIAQSGKAFNDSVIAASKLPDKGVGQLPVLAVQFDTVVRPFLALLDSFKLLGPSASALLSASI